MTRHHVQPIPLPRWAPRTAAAVVASAALLFAVLALDLQMHGAITRIDVAISRWFQLHHHPVATWFMVAVTAPHGTRGILAMTAAAVVALAWWGQRHWIPVLLATVPGGLLLNASVKLAFQRARPSIEHPLLVLTTFSFPSGHAAGATVWWGFLLVLAMNAGFGAAARAACIVLAVGAVALTAVSRVVLGVHFPSDVLAGIAEGVFWIVLCFSLAAPRTRGPRG